MSDLGALGTDIAGVDDVDLFLSTADESTSAAQAVLRTLLFAPGTLWWAPDVGFDLNSVLHGFFDAARVERAVQTQCEQDERVLSATYHATAFGDEIRLQVAVKLTTNPSDVTLTLAISQLGAVLDASVTV